MPWALNHPLLVTQRRIDPERHFFRHDLGGTATCGTPRSRSAGSPAGRSTTPSRSGRSTSSRVSPTAGGSSSARSTTRWPTATPPTRCSATSPTSAPPTGPRHSPATPTTTRCCRRAAGWRSRRCGTPSSRSHCCPRLLLSTVQGIASMLRYRREHETRGPAADRPRSAGVVQRPADAAPQLRHGHAAAGRPQGGTPGARRDAQRRGARGDVRSAATVDGRTRRAAVGLPDGRRAGRSRRCRQRPATGRQQRVQPLHDPGDRRRRPGRAAAPDLPHRRARQGDEPAARERDARRLEPVRAAVPDGPRHPPLQPVPGGALPPGRLQRDRLERARSAGGDQHRRCAADRHLQRRPARRRDRAQRHGLVVRRPDELLAARLPRPAAGRRGAGVVLPGGAGRAARASPSRARQPRPSRTNSGPTETRSLHDLQDHRPVLGEGRPGCRARERARCSWSACAGSATAPCPTYRCRRRARAVDLPGRGTTHVLDLPGPTPDAPTLLLMHGIATTGPLTWFSVLEELRAALPGGDVRPALARAGHPVRSSSRSTTAPTTRSPCSTRSASTAPSSSATRWAGPAPRCCGTGIPTGSPAWCSARPRPAGRATSASGSSS